MSLTENPITTPQAADPASQAPRPGPTPPQATPVGSISRRDRPSRGAAEADSRTAVGLTALVSAMRANRAAASSR